MKEKNRNSIEDRRKVTAFTTMNVIEGQADLGRDFSLIFYSLTLNNILNIIVLLILAGVTIATLIGDNGILTKATEAKDKTEEGEEEEKVKLSVAGALAKDNGGEIKEGYLDEELASQFGKKGTDYSLEGSGPFTVTIIESGRNYLINEDGTLGEVVEREGIKVGDYVNYVYNIPIDVDTIEKGYPLLCA